MATVKLAINLGSENTTIYFANKGVVLNEPSLMLYKGDIIYSVGQKALLSLQNDFEEDLQIVNPIKNGKVDNVLAAASLLRIFLSKIVEDFKCRIIAAICVPCGLSANEKKDFLSVAYKSGISTAYLCPAPVCAFFDFQNFNKDNACFIADMGSQCCDIAYIDDGQIVYGQTIEFDNKNIDDAIMKMIEYKYDVLVTPEIVKKLKDSVCSLNFLVTLDKLVTGIDVSTRKVRKTRVSVVDVSGIVKNFYDLVFDEVLELKKQIGQEANPVLYLTGGPARADYLKEYGEKYTGMEIFCANGLSTVSGLGRIVENNDIFSRIIKRKK